jgi:hypothetical protein
MKKALLIALALSLVVFTVAGAGATSSVKVSGYISDSVCGARGANIGYADCSTKCLTKGAQLVIVVDGTQQLLAIENPEVVKGHECNHVLVTGDVNTQASSIRIYSLRII